MKIHVRPLFNPNTTTFLPGLRVILVLLKKVIGKVSGLGILTAQETGFVPALPLTLHLLGKVHRFLAAATLVSSS